MEYPSAHDFFLRSNTHDPDQDRFPDLYCWDFVHTLSRVAHHKLAHHQLDPYQRAAFQHSIIHHNIGEEEANPSLEMVMKYAGAVGVIVFDESCHLCGLTEAQVGQNQFTMDVAVDHLDEKDAELEDRANEASKRMSILEGYQALLALGRDQVTTRVQACVAIATLAVITTDQQAQLVRVEERMDAMREMLLVLEHMRENPIVVDNESDGETAVSNGVELEVEENEVAIPIPPPGRLVPIEDVEQVLPDELVGTQIAFDLAEEDRPPSYE